MHGLDPRVDTIPKVTGAGYLVGLGDDCYETRPTANRRRREHSEGEGGKRKQASLNGMLRADPNDHV